jgi:hypothetical protein
MSQIEYEVVPGACFVMVVDEFGEDDSPTRCPKLVEWCGVYIEASGIGHQVESCADHAGGLQGPFRVDGSRAF